ncbi:MAG: hypothetical protein CMJ33_06250 [Phycisphaerae bacterium]|nr:hypothetical protein [Phycisphaerae bacterium]HAW94915.1 hypothetical protein [Phycisphaerales bacterium]|tara:strand:- start:322 stop:942 length:621 start_codon:yes stop_codon:yes gene_type:complete
MRILIDGQDSGLSAETIPEALKQGMDAVDSTGRIVVEIALDGSPLDAEQLESGAYETSAAETLSLMSLAPNELLLATFELGRNAIDAAQKHFHSAAEMIQAGDDAGAMNELHEGIELWCTIDQTVFREAVPKIAELGGDQTPDGLERHVGELKDALESIKSAIESSDFAGLSDALMYEFPETSAGWSTFLGNCSQVVAGQSELETE